MQLLFNPSHEMALAANRQNFLPPRRIQQMEEELKEFPWVWWEDDDGDVSVWGWNKCSKHTILSRGVDASRLPSDDELERWRQLSDRSFSAAYLRLILHDLQQKGCSCSMVGSEMQILKSVEELERLSQSVPNALSDTYIVKLPFSSSGRGNFTGQLSDPRFLNRVKELLHRHGSVVLDRFYDKLLDFALEYDVKPDGEVLFLGYSVFEASSQGRYGGNVVDSQPRLKALIEQYARQGIEALADLHRQRLQEQTAGRYRGFAGIDMMVVEDDGERKIHPCVEINFRMNMGIVALRLFRKLEMLSRLVAEGKTYGDCVQRPDLRFLAFLSETDFNAFHFGDLYQLLRSSTRLPLSPRRDCGFQAFLQSGRLCLGFS